MGDFGGHDRRDQETGRGGTGRGGVRQPSEGLASTCVRLDVHDAFHPSSRPPQGGFWAGGGGKRTVGRLVPAEPLTDARDGARVVLLDVADVVDVLGVLVRAGDRDHLPIELPSQAQGVRGAAHLMRFLRWRGGVSAGCVPPSHGVHGHGFYGRGLSVGVSSVALGAAGLVCAAAVQASECA